MNKKIKNLTTYLPAFLLGVVLILLFAIYAALAIYNIQSEYQLKSLQSQITQLERENRALYLQLNETNSLETVLENSEELMYTEVQEVSYIQQASTSPFATR